MSSTTEGDVTGCLENNQLVRDGPFVGWLGLPHRSSTGQEASNVEVDAVRG